MSALSEELYFISFAGRMLFFVNSDRFCSDNHKTFFPFLAVSIDDTIRFYRLAFDVAANR